ncbi:hypothetical protein M407DRAFT_224400 [Tulasnella calospora MUT 4182]|uniref:Extracellular membrane protein CFEM domain-containing protein n=1 Tax=Tulasnella calospora MUT 4182 TaxID=1051891 RepID=A0A0C3QFZ5_9AGAM|nr:hypothetical protein M407DRAFT_224400 [Tulasnella calospora MUT 4182]
MKASTSLALIVSAVAITAVNGGSLLAGVLRPRVVDEIWGGVNLTASVLEVYNAISQPTCNATDYCVQLATTVVPTCLKNQGTAGCWCTLHDPIHYCAICMSSPTDNTTNPDQTQAATEGHTNYHRGCSAWQAFLNASAAGSLSTSQPPSTSAPLPTITQDQANTGSSKSTVSTGAIVGIAIGGICFIAVVVAATIIIWKCLKNQADRAARPAVLAGATNEKGPMTMGDPVRVTNYYSGNTDMGDRIPNTPPLPYANHPMSQPMSLQSMYSSGAVAGNMTGGARPDTMFSDSPTMSTRPGSNMRQGSEFGGSSNSGQPLMQGQYQVTNDMSPQRTGISSPPPPWSQQHPQP